MAFGGSRKNTVPVWLWLGAIILTAFALRVFLLSAQDIWWDEARNIFTASRPLEQIASAPELDIHPPLYFYLLHFWLALAGTSEFIVRFFSVWFGVALIPLVFRLGKQLQDAPLGLWAAFLVALSAFLIEEAHETRMYTLLLFLAALSIYFLLRAVRFNRWRAWLAFAVSATLSFYTHYSFVYILAAQNLFLFFCWLNDWRNRRPVKKFFQRWTASQVLIGALYIFQIPNIVRQTHIYGNPGMTPPSLAQYVVELARAFFLGTKIQIEALTFSSIATALALLSITIGAWRLRRNGAGDRRWMLIAMWLIVPLVLYFFVLFKSPQFTPRYAIVSSVPLFLLLAWASRRVAASQRSVGALVGLLLVAGNWGAWQSQFFNPAFFNDDTRGLAQFISEKATRDDLVLIDVPFPFFYYYRGVAPADYLFVDIHTTAEVLTQKARGKHRLYYIQWYKSDTDPRGYVPFLLNKYAAFAGDTALRGYNIAWYELPRDVSFALASAPQSTEAVFGDKLKLTGFAFGGVVTPSNPNPDVPRATVGSQVWVALWWQAMASINRNYKVSVQLHNAQGDNVAQDDRTLIDDHHLPTTHWINTEIAINVYMPELENVPPGRYTLHVIVYDPENGENLKVGPNTSFEIGQIDILP